MDFREDWGDWNRRNNSWNVWKTNSFSCVTQKGTRKAFCQDTENITISFEEKVHAAFNNGTVCPWFVSPKECNGRFNVWTRSDKNLEAFYTWYLWPGKFDVDRKSLSWSGMVIVSKRTRKNILLLSKRTCKNVLLLSKRIGKKHITFV